SVGTGPDGGRAYCYLGRAPARATTPAWTADPADQNGAHFGWAVSGAGDVNGDGFADLIAGAWGYDGQAGNEGKAYLFLGNATGLGTTPAWTVDPTDQGSADFGFAA